MSTAGGGGSAQPAARRKRNSSHRLYREALSGVEGGYRIKCLLLKMKLARRLVSVT